MTSNYVYGDEQMIIDAWDALTEEQTAELERAWEKISTSDMTALEAVIDYIADVGLEGIGKETTEESLAALDFEDFRTIIED